ncbi:MULTISPECIES: nitrite reductase small subunit NirD [Paenibacillus]|jgi:nitrite reductase (NADH) small subunit|uniref:Nitrite reductase (NAD(P)H), small subunit n=2 Tax=Paenibacillus lactis TaxID=228574 RepID=G4HCT8_9BACL|nr:MULTISPECIES: nitrite reductase small subunit NirD [Paenibacillus]EHB65864.1 nitrite reductase (NAD(P)H), small subunit [Paenibacillus lactis 154]MBP1891247.1 nitrite reductase (NADH) small subunit [Paenibacillus lactis]MCM3493699.1 nitrite reductase small subunit NirD [Paenibacillus lactis]GIO92942.1 assimilatory nitrite reductase [NAD(P)H] small subunit [Paenibacillus lactis]HAF98381.1 nitrite reductase (NAD(P)H) small subunit [Paenibacillus lactis]
MSKIRVASLAEIDAKGARTFRIEDTEIAVFRLSDGSVKAVENRCPHKGGKLSEGMVCGTAVHCPLHDWKIDLASGRVYEPDDGCVTTYRTEIDGTSGSIYIVM